MLIHQRQIKKAIAQFQQHNFLEKRFLKAIILFVLMDLFFGVLFFLTEQGAQPKLTLFDSVWWALVTMTTVGYGDFFAVTIWGRIISLLCMLIGIGVIGYLIGFFADHILRTISKTRRGLMKVLDEDHLIICNYPGENKIIEVVKELKAAPQYKDTAITLITNEFEELPEELKKLKLRYVRGIPTNEDILFKANILHCKGVIILGDQTDPQISDERSFAVGTVIELIEKEYQKPIKTIVEVLSRKNLKLMQRSDIDGLTLNDGITSRMLVQEFLYPGIHDIIQQLLSNLEGSQFYIFPTQLVGRKVIDIQTEILKHPANMQVIGIIKDGEKILNPPKSMQIETDDQLILLAENYADFEEIEKSLLN